jgi:hypothetical protein
MRARAHATARHGDDKKRMSKATDLMAACAAGDELGISRLGWRPVMDALRAWPKQLDGYELTPYAMVLGDHDPDKVVAAILSLATSKWRPGAAEIRARMLENQGRETGPPVVPPAGGPRVPVLAVIEAVVAGELVCECFPRPTDVNVDQFDVQRCPDCEGIEVGQYEQALEALAGDAP